MNCKQCINPCNDVGYTSHFRDDSSEPEDSSYGVVEDPDTMQLDAHSSLGQILDLGGRSIGSLQGEEAAELGSKLHSVCFRFVIPGGGAYLNIQII